MRLNQTISNWMTTYLSQLLNINSNQVDISLQFDNYGLDSIHAAQLIGELSDWLDLDLDPGIIYDYPSINELSHYLANMVDREET